MDYDDFHVYVNLKILNSLPKFISHPKINVTYI